MKISLRSHAIRGRIFEVKIVLFYFILRFICLISRERKEKKRKEEKLNEFEIYHVFDMLIKCF